MSISRDKIEEVRKKIRETIESTDMEMEDEPQASGDPNRIFDDEESEDSSDEK